MKQLLAILLISGLASCATNMYAYRKCPTNDKKFFYNEMGARVPKTFRK